MISPDGFELDYVEELDIPVKIEDPENFRPIFEYGRDYTVTQRETCIKEKMPCQACNTREKTNHRVVVRDDASEQEFRIGLKCMAENFDITEAELNNSVRPVTRLVESWHKFSLKARPHMHRLESRDAELQLMYELLPQSLGFNCPAAEDAVGLIQRLLEFKAYVRDFKEDIEALETFIGLQNDFLHHKVLFRDRAINLQFHPRLSKNERHAAKELFDALSRLTWRRLRELHQIFGKARRAQMPITKVIEVPPHLYASEASYRSALQNYIMQLCNRDEGAYAVHNYARAVQQTVEDDLRNPNSGLSKSQFAAYSLADESEAAIREHKLLRSVTHLIDQKRYSYHFPSKTRPFRQDRSRRKAQSLQSMQRENQLEERDDVDRSVLENGYFRQLGL